MKFSYLTREINDKKIVSCEECKCLIKISDSQVIKIEADEIYYCSTHKKPYSRIGYRGINEDSLLFDAWYFSLESRKNFYKEMEVDENGEPIGYTKNEEKASRTLKNKKKK